MLQYRYSDGGGGVKRSLGGLVVSELRISRTGKDSRGCKVWDISVALE